MSLQERRKMAGAAKMCRTWRKVQVLQVLMAGLLLAACAGTVEPEIRTVRVEVPVQVPCRVPEVEVPQWATIGLKKGDSLEVKVRALMAERRQRIGYERKLLAALHACG
jgi:hypothetical protein